MFNPNRKVKYGERWWTIVAEEDRNTAEPLPGVKLLGSVYTLKDEHGNIEHAYPWEVWDPEGFDGIE